MSRLQRIYIQKWYIRQRRRKENLAGSQGRTLRKVWDCGGIRRPEKHRSAVMFEALGSGKPVIGTKVGGVQERITSDDYGLLCEPANPKELAEKILIALDKEWNNEKILEYAGRFRWEDIAKETLNVYFKL